MDSGQPHCDERYRLARIHTEALHEWARIVRDIVDSADADLRRHQLAAIDEARAMADDARDAVHRHVEQHGC